MKNLQKEYSESFYDRVTLDQINNYLKGMNRLLPKKDMIAKLKKKWNLKKIEFNPMFTKILAIEKAETNENDRLKRFKNFNNITEARDAYIWDTKPQTLEDAEDPEIMTNGFGRLGFSQLKDKLVKASKQFAVWAKDGNYDSIESFMSSYHNMLETLQVIEKEMKKPAWKRKITTLKRAGK